MNLHKLLQNNKVTGSRWWRRLRIPEEVEHGIRRKWNIDSGRWNTDSGKWNIESGGSGTAVPEVVNARR